MHIPTDGLSVGDVVVSAVLATDGTVTGLVAPSVTTVCAVYDSSVVFSTKYMPAMSAVSFMWTAGPTALAMGDRVVFTLPAYAWLLGTTARPISSDDDDLSGSGVGYYSVLVTTSTINLHGYGGGGEQHGVGNRSLSVFASAGFLVPPTHGVRKDFFHTCMT